MTQSIPLVLGTVQLGLAYGRRAGQELMSEAEAFAILDAAWTMGVRAFDVAEAYGVACERLASWLRQRGYGDESQVITKVRIDDPAAITARLAAALDPFAGLTSLTLLTHGAADSSTWSRLREWAAQAGAAAGQSVYDRAEVEAAVVAPGISRIQAPGNIFDRQALEARGNRPVPLDLRSAYLQGVLLESADRAERRAPGTGALAAAVQAAAAEVGRPASSLLVAALARRLSAGDRIVMGVDHPAELESVSVARDLAPEIVVRFEQQVDARVPGTVDRNALDPRRWAAQLHTLPPTR